MKKSSAIVKSISIVSAIIMLTSCSKQVEHPLNNRNILNSRISAFQPQISANYNYTGTFTTDNTSMAQKTKYVGNSTLGDSATGKN